MVSMTDEELIKRLRLQSEHVPADTIFDAAADRIEQLVAINKQLVKGNIARKVLAELEKTELMETLEFYERKEHDPISIVSSS
jgi:hypothetical protein